VLFMNFFDILRKSRARFLPCLIILRYYEIILFQNLTVIVVGALPEQYRQHD